MLKLDVTSGADAALTSDDNPVLQESSLPYHFAFRSHSRRTLHACHRSRNERAARPDGSHRRPEGETDLSEHNRRDGTPGPVALQGAAHFLVSERGEASSYRRSDPKNCWKVSNAEKFNQGFKTTEYLAASLLVAVIIGPDSVEWFKQTAASRARTASISAEFYFRAAAGADAMKLFGDFIGREPYIEPLLERHGLKTSGAQEGSAPATSAP